MKLEYRFVEAVLYSSFVHEEPVEDPCICEVLYGHTTESQMGGRGSWPGLRLVVVFEKQRLGEFGQWAGGIIRVQCVYGLVLDSPSAF